MIEYEELYNNVESKYGDYCVKDLKEVFDDGVLEKHLNKVTAFL